MNITTKHFTRNSNPFNIMPTYKRIVKRKTLPRIRLGDPPISTLVQELCLFYKIFKEKLVYLFNLIPTKNSNYNTRNADKITLFHAEHNFLKILFFNPRIELNMLDPNFRSAASRSVFNKNLLKFIKIYSNRAFNCQNWKGIKYLTSAWAQIQT